MKEKLITKCPNRLFHLSPENHNGEWFRPRVPKSIVSYFNSEDNEDDTVRRVCFSGSISGAFFAISFDGHPQKLYVHVQEHNAKKSIVRVFLQEIFVKDVISKDA